jgi:hypothetical protein
MSTSVCHVEQTGLIAATALEEPSVQPQRRDAPTMAPRSAHRRNAVKLAPIAIGSGWLVLRLTRDLSFVFVALSVGLAAFGLINTKALASGAVIGVTSGRHPRKGTRLWFRNSAPVSNLQ